MKHLEANIVATLLEKAYNLSNIGVATPNVPAQVSLAEMGVYLVEGEMWLNCKKIHFLLSFPFILVDTPISIPTPRGYTCTRLSCLPSYLSERWATIL